jgi:diadenosine tetraphosphate (Ap4A) HIT family hydrolase
VNKQSTIFDQIIAKKIKSEIIYEDEEVIAFNDICP